MEELFSQELPVLIKLTSEERFVKIRTSVFSKTSASSSTPFSRELVLRLTDDSDPFFLHTLALTEEEYSDLKCQQGLLIDFASFPHKLIELLNLCKSQHGGEQPKFLLQLVHREVSSSSSAGGRTLLEVVETNPFKHLTHLSLRVLPGTDRTVKDYLAECLRGYKTENGRLSEELAVCKDELARSLSAARAAAAQQQSEFLRLQDELKSRLSELSLQSQHELHTEREESQKRREEVLGRIESEKKQLQLRLSREETERGEEKRELENRTTELREQVLRLESFLEQTKKERESYSNRCREQEENLSHTRLQNLSSQSRAEDQSDEMRRLSSRLASSEQECGEKEQRLARSALAVEELTADRNRLEAAAQHKQLLVGKLEQAVKTASQEVNKGNEIIHKLQQELHSTKTRLRLKSTVTMEQEKAIAERDLAVKRLSAELEIAQKESARGKEACSSAREESEAARKELAECQEQIKTNENVISWLNKQLNDRTINRTQPLPGPMNYSLPLGSRLPVRTPVPSLNPPLFNGTPSLPLPTSQFQLQYKKKTGPAYSAADKLVPINPDAMMPFLPFGNPVTTPNPSTLSPPPIRAKLIPTAQQDHSSHFDMPLDPRYLTRNNPQLPFNPIAPLSLTRPMI